MREILFRGKRVDNGEWCLGFIEFESNGCWYISFPTDEGGESFEVDPETVGQFTGLLDKNGVRIFEGDLIYIGESLHVIVWNEKGYWLCKPTKGNTYYYTGRALWFKDTEFPHATVIGNIHDNRELLEVVE